MDDGGRGGFGGPEMAQPEMRFGSNVEIRSQKIRKFFPETWIWDLIPVGYVSCTMALMYILYTLQSFLIMHKKIYTKITTASVLINIFVTF